MKKEILNLIKIGLVFTSSIFLSACNEKKPLSEEQKSQFDRTQMLDNIASNIIIPSYLNTIAELDKLQVALSAFEKSTSVSELSTLRNAWLNAYKAFQMANSFNFGPAGEEGTRKSIVEEIATFPVSETKIENAISTSTYNFKDFNRDNRGFLAIEYMLFDKTKSAEQHLELLKKPERLQYLKDLITDALDKIKQISTSWNSGYKSEFINNNGTDAGSSTSMLYNEFVKSFEALKNFKLGLPLGKRAGQVSTEPNRVEAYYSGASIIMLKAHFLSLKNIWSGIGLDGQDRIGFKEYLEAVEGGKDLVLATENQLRVIENLLSKINDDVVLSDAIITNDETINNLYIEIQKHTRYFKGDMSSLLGITITFTSGDGD